MEYDPTPLGSDATNTSWEITLRIDTTSYSGSGVRIGDVAFKVSSHLNGGMLLEAPGGAGDWTWQLGGLNANGCDGHGGGFGCATSNSSGVATVPSPDIYKWVFEAHVPNGTTLFTGPSEDEEPSIKVRYLDDEGDKIGALVSEHIMLQVVPEPGTALLLAFGLAGLVHAGSPRR